MHIIGVILDAATFVADVFGLAKFYRWVGRKMRGKRNGFSKGDAAMSEIRMEARVIGPSAHGYLKVTLQGPGDGTKDVDVPMGRLPPEVRMPNTEFVAVVSSGEFIRVESAGSVWLEIQRQIQSVLNGDWDPIGVADSVADEYDSHIAGLYSMLKEGYSSDTIASHLATLESQMGMTVNRSEHLRNIAEKLRALSLPTIADTR